MEDLEGQAWLLERFGADGPRLRMGVPALLWRCHLGMADAQDRAPMKSQAVYGQIWRAVHDGIEDDFGSLPTAQLYRPPSAPYKVVVVNGTALFPWRFARDAVTDIDQAGFGTHVSSTRQAVLAGVGLPPMLPFGDGPLEGVPDETAEEIERYRAGFRETVAEHPVVVVAYASNQTSLLSAFWGDIKGLRADGTLEWGRRERLDLSRPTQPERRLRVVRDDEDRPSFADAPLHVPVIGVRRVSSDGQQNYAGSDGRG